jgi:hypothetical protein
MIKNHRTVCSKTLYEMYALYRLCLSGTPIQSPSNVSSFQFADFLGLDSMKDLGSLIRFLGIRPWCEQKYFNRIENVRPPARQP